MFNTSPPIQPGSTRKRPQTPHPQPQRPTYDQTPQPWHTRPKRPTDGPMARLHPSSVTSTPGVDSRACTTSVATPAMSTHSMSVQRDEETTRRQRADDVPTTTTPLASTGPHPSPTTTPNAMHRRKASTARHAPQARPPQQYQRTARTRKTKRQGKGGKTTDDETTGGRRRAHHVHKTAAQPHIHAKRRTSTPGIDSPVCTVNVATPAIDAQHHTERRRGEGGKGKGEEDETREGREDKMSKAE
ncbi:hypothetical protein PAXINDRAFT_16840 [Paxillus involutus ATCC 200175]|uniref:Uncharacterized protein n=1 Tax=Paxillus involutus ATCC 200175 TaxID=664439 RepID=A0A0C9TQY3_PAXIN|nr:hypothetical protein PAXINDRAFT_16840 [Paxillus involutus ATCC 200175]